MFEGIWRPKMKKEIAENLLKIEAVFLRPDDPFTWASGIKSPIYCDNRLTLSAPATRDLIENSIAEVVSREYPQAEILMGTSTAGIAHAAIAAHILGMPMGYVRGAAKDHGRTNRIEGKLTPGEKAVVVEDLISTGGSAIETVQALRDAGAEVLGIVSIFTYGMQKGLDRMDEANVKNVSLCDLDTLVKVAVEKKYIAASDEKKLLAFRDDPSDESWMKGESDER
jgi:orotate phosphoribosyltransferase